MITKHLRLLREGGGGCLWSLPLDLMVSVTDSSSSSCQKWSCRFPDPGPRKWPVATKTLALETKMPSSQKLNALQAKADIQRNQVLRATALAEQPAGVSSTYLTRYSSHPVSWSSSPAMLLVQDWLPNLWETV